ncbi:MAG: YDG domain-containing protein, partial [Clostridia bacterium]
AIEGKIQNLKVIDMGNFYRASFYVDYTNANTDHNINIKSTAGGHIYLDNLVVAHEDYAPLATNGTYNSVGAGDVDISIDLKGKDLSSIAIKGGATLTAGTDYVVGVDKVTIKASQFANLPQQIVYVLTTTGGSAEFTVSQVDNRKEITDITSTFAFEKNYDGTMVVSTTGAEFTLVGIDAGHDVKFSGSFVYASKNAGVVEVALTNVVLSGANAGEYKVKESYAFIGKINKIQLAIGDPVVTKVKAYDGAVTANATAGALTGVVEQEVVTVTATAVYNSKNVVDANKITVSYIIDGADKDNYIAPISTEVTEGVSITKIQLSLENEVVTKTKVYDGNVTASIVKGALKGILGSEKVTIEAVATYNSKDVASANKISIAYTLGGEDKGNYLVPSNREISEGIAITAKSITVTAEAKSVESGKEDPILTYKVSGLVGSDALTGALAREAGTKAGEYNITLGTLKAGSNYAITFVGAKLTVTEVAPTGCCAVVFDTNSAVGMTLIMLVCIAVVLALILIKKKIN